MRRRFCQDGEKRGPLSEGRDPLFAFYGDYAKNPTATVAAVAASGV